VGAAAPASSPDEELEDMGKNMDKPVQQHAQDEL